MMRDIWVITHVSCVSLLLVCHMCPLVVTHMSCDEMRSALAHTGYWVTNSLWVTNTWSHLLLLTCHVKRYDQHSLTRVIESRTLYMSHEHMIPLVVTHSTCNSLYDVGWLRLVCSWKLKVSSLEYHLFYRALLQKKPIILRSILTPLPTRMSLICHYLYIITCMYIPAAVILGCHYVYTITLHSGIMCSWLILVRDSLRIHHHLHVHTRGSPTHMSLLIYHCLQFVTHISSWLTTLLIYQCLLTHQCLYVIPYMYILEAVLLMCHFSGVNSHTNVSLGCSHTYVSLLCMTASSSDTWVRLLCNDIQIVTPV